MQIVKCDISYFMSMRNESSQENSRAGIERRTHTHIQTHTEDESIGILFISLRSTALSHSNRTDKLS